MDNNGNGQRPDLPRRADRKKNMKGGKQPQRQAVPPPRPAASLTPSNDMSTDNNRPQGGIKQAKNAPPRPIPASPKQSRRSQKLSGLNAIERTARKEKKVIIILAALTAFMLLLVAILAYVLLPVLFNTTPQIPTPTPSPTVDNAILPTASVTIQPTSGLTSPPVYTPSPTPTATNIETATPTPTPTPTQAMPVITTLRVRYGDFVPETMGEQEVTIGLSLPADVTLTITRNGQTVQSMLRPDTSLPAGDQRLYWDGLDNNGTRVPNGTYEVRLVLTVAGQQVASGSTTFTVSGGQTTPQVTPPNVTQPPASTPPADVTPPGVTEAPVTPPPQETPSEPSTEPPDVTPFAAYMPR